MTIVNDNAVEEKERFRVIIKKTDNTDQRIILNPWKALVKIFDNDGKYSTLAPLSDCRCA